MKTITMALLSGLVLMALSTPAHASDKKTCKVATNDVGTIVGRGSNSEKAFEDAATQCFDRHAQLYKMRKGKDMTDDDAGLTVIDVCANISCA